MAPGGPPGGRPTPRVGIPSFAPSDLPDRVLEAGAEPVLVPVPAPRPSGGVALAREWVADVAHVLCAREELDGLLLAAGNAEGSEDLAGLVLAALRLGLPAVVSPPPDPVWAAAFAALGLSPLAEEPARVAALISSEGEPSVGELVEGFSLANALRAGVSAGGGPEMLVHLCAIAREAGAVGFGEMMRVLVPETPSSPEPVAGDGVAGLLARLAETFNDTRTVSGRLREALPQPSSASPALPRRRLAFVAGRASGAEALCLTAGEKTEIAGGCAVFAAEDLAVRAVEGGEVGPGSLLVVGGCGPRGGPGLLRLDRLARALEEDGLAKSVPVVTDGLPPERVAGAWASLFSPEAAGGGVISRLRDGDSLRFDLAEGRIRTGVGAEEFRGREPVVPAPPAGAGYAVRYARSALPALSGAGFG